MTMTAREMTPEEIAVQIVGRKRPRKWLAADLAAIIERANKRAVAAYRRDLAKQVKAGFVGWPIDVRMGWNGALTAVLRLIEETP